MSAGVAPISTARAEQETTITQGRDDEWVKVWTNNPVHARKLQRDARATCVSGIALPGGVVGGTYRIRSSDFSVLSGFRRRGGHVWTDEEKAAAAVRLRVAREARA